MKSFVIWKDKAYALPKGYHKTEDGFFMNGHGVEYALVQYGNDDDCCVCLESVYARHVRTIELERLW